MATFQVPEEYYYTKEHEWAQVDENIVTVGITQYAQHSLGEIVYVELPEEGRKGFTRRYVRGGGKCESGERFVLAGFGNSDRGRSALER